MKPQNFWMAEGPKSIRELLVEIKDNSDRMVDLALASLYFEDEELANLVRRLEERMDELSYQFFQCAAVVSRSREEAKRLVGLLQIAVSAENISNACGDLITPVLKRMGVHPLLKDALASASEKLAKIKIREGSHLANQRLGDSKLPSTLGVWVLAIKRGESYEIPNKDTIPEPNDLLVVKGPLEGLRKVCKMCGETFKPPSPSAKFRTIRKTLAKMRDAALLSVDLAYSSVLLNLPEPAQLVGEIEEKFDRLSYKLWAETLKLAKKGEKELASMLETVRYLERITDSADLIADLMVRGIEPHPVLAEVVEETDEKISRIQVKPGSVLENRTVGELNLWATTGTYILFLERGEEFIYTPSARTKILVGDRLVLRGSYAGIEKVRRLAEAGVPEA